MLYIKFWSNGSSGKYISSGSIPFDAEHIFKNLSKILKIPQDSISIKATTMEKLGPIGEGQAIAVQSVVLLEKISPTGKCSSNFDAED